MSKTSERGTNKVIRYDDVLTTEETDEILSELAHQHLQEVLSPAGGTTAAMASHLLDANYGAIAGYELDYGDSEADPMNYYHLRQIMAFWQKRQDLVLEGVDRLETSMVKFIEAEHACRRTDEVFRRHAAGQFQFRPAVEAVLHGAQRKIAQVLGDCPSLEDIKVRFGPGATTQVKKKNASPRSKLGQTFACSEEFLEVLPECLEELQGWVFQHQLEGADTASVAVEVHNGKLNFVPKNAKTHRAVMVEPSLNVMFQLGIGDHIAVRLARFGVDIRDQSLNQRLAREGSFTGALATLDLSAASDTISRELVYHLLPVDWFLMLDSFCTRTVEYDGVVRKLAKFSTMGNGFTFALETLIFWGLARAASENKEVVSVYGDDIIVETHRYPLLCEVLQCCGFTVNREKSFASGPFRESCGKDYYRGIDIRPCYIKDRLSGADLFRLHNYYVRAGLPEFAVTVLQYIAEPLRLWGPDGYGDGHLLGDWNPTPHRRSDGWGGYLFDTYLWRGVSSPRSYIGDVIVPSYSIYVGSRESEDEMTCFSVSPPDNQGAARMERIYTAKCASAFISSVTLEKKGGKRAVRPPLLHGERREAPPTQYRYDRRNRLWCSLPGRKGYKRVSVYTFKSA